MCARDTHELCAIRHDLWTTMRQPVGMALFGMVWLLRVRSEMKRCTKCRRQQQQRINVAADDGASAATFFTIDAPAAVTNVNTPSPGQSLPHTTYCEVHGFNLPKEDIQEFYELTLLDDSKSVQEKTAETIRIANKWESSDGPIAPTYTNNDFVIFAAVLAYANAGNLIAPLAAAPLAYAAPAIAKVAVAQPEPYDPHPQYQFGYDVQDGLTGDSKSQVEQRDGDVVQGSYSLNEPDGTRRTVDYTADPIHGFNAVVRKEPLVAKAVVAAPAIAKVAAPIVAQPVLRSYAAPAIAAAPLIRSYAAPAISAPLIRSYAAPAIAAAPLLRSYSAPGIHAAPLLRSYAAPAVHAAPVLSSYAAPAIHAAPLLRSAPIYSTGYAPSLGYSTLLH